MMRLCNFTWKSSLLGKLFFNHYACLLLVFPLSLSLSLSPSLWFHRDICMCVLLPQICCKSYLLWSHTSFLPPFKCFLLQRWNLFGVCFWRWNSTSVWLEVYAVLAWITLISAPLWGGGWGGGHVIYSLYCVHWRLCMHSVDIIDIFPDLAESITLNSYFSDNFCKVLCLLGKKIWINLRRKHFFRSSQTSPKLAFELRKGSKCYHFWYTSFNAVASLVLPISFSVPVAVRLVEIMNKKC